MNCRNCGHSKIRMRNGRLLLLATLLCAVTGVSAMTAEPRHDLVRVPLADPNAAEFVRTHQGEFDIVYTKPGVEVYIAATSEDMAALRAAGLAPGLLQSDMETANAYPEKGIGFGVYHTYSENTAFVDSLRLRFPNVISDKWSIGTTFEGRDIWAFRLSDNPDVDEDEPEVLIEGLHHAREIMAGEFAIMFAEYLATNYETDPEIAWLVDHRELYVIPVVNPDGVVYNETTNPNGGGLWRKNRCLRSGVWGVDLYRNYPNHWGYDNIGSSSLLASIMYRGPSAASELETQAMLAFVAGREIVTHNSLHSFSPATVRPWGYANVPTSHEAVFNKLTAEMTKFNGYPNGQIGTTLYNVNGGAMDSFYGDTANHSAIFSLLTEIGNGNDGFWPRADRRGELFQENLWPNLHLLRVAGPFIAVHTPVVVASGKAIDPGDSGTLSFTIENQSVAATAAGATVTIRTDDPWIQLQAAERSFGALWAQDSTTLADDPIPFVVDGACTPGHQVRLTATVHLEDGAFEFPLSFVVGTAPLVFSDDLEEGVGNWTSSGTWAAATNLSHSASHSLTDSPGASYPVSALSSVELNGTWRASKLRFWHQYWLEQGYDHVFVQVSADGGPWTTPATYTGVLSAWTQVTVDLGAYAGSDLALRFLLTSDPSVNSDGWYIDDVELEGDPFGSFAMERPVAMAPVANAVCGSQPVLIVGNSVVPGGGDAVYGFRVYRDVQCTDLAASADNVAEAPQETAWTCPTLADGEYWWRAWAGDGTSRTSLTAAEKFTVSAGSAVGTGEILGLRVLDAVGGGDVRLELTMPARAEVTLDIHDARGARVRRVYAGDLDGGSRVLFWDGRDGQGRMAASGVYFVRARIGERTLRGRAVIVK